MPRLSRCERSPTPVSVGANTRWPLARSRSATRRQHQPPCQLPCTSTKAFAVSTMDGFPVDSVRLDANLPGEPSELAGLQPHGGREFRRRVADRNDADLFELARHLG